MLLPYILQLTDEFLIYFLSHQGHVQPLSSKSCPYQIIPRPISDYLETVPLPHSFWPTPKCEKGTKDLFRDEKKHLTCIWTQIICVMMIWHGNSSAGFQCNVLSTRVFSNTVSMEILGFEQLQYEELLTVEGMIIIFTPNLLKVNSKKRNLFTASFICIVYWWICFIKSEFREPSQCTPFFGNSFN